MWSRTKTLLTRSPSLCPRPTSSKTWVFLPLLSVCELPLHRHPFTLIRLTISANLVSRSHNSTRHPSTTLSPFMVILTTAITCPPLPWTLLTFLISLWLVAYFGIPSPGLTLPLRSAVPTNTRPPLPRRASILVLHFLVTTVEHSIVYLRKV